MSHDDPLWTLLDKLQMDARQLNARIVELRSQVAALKLEGAKRHRCARCGMSFAGRSTLEEHAYHAHDGPLPAAWVAAEARVELPDGVAE